MQGDRVTEKVSICACLLCAFPALRFAKCSLTVRQVQFRSPLAKIITTSKRKCARSCGAGDAVQGGGRCPKQYLSVLRGCISAHCANIQPHNLAFSVAKYLLSTTLLLYYVQPKLVNVKLANKLQTVHQLHRGWRGVA